MEKDDLTGSKAAKNVSRGWFPLLKSTITHKVVGFKKPFTKAEAWIWLLSETEWEDTRRLFTVGRGDRLVECPAGTVTHSVRFLSRIWGWSKTRTQKYLKLLETDLQIRQKRVQQITQISIVNWASYRELTTKQGRQQGRQQDGNRDGNRDKPKEAKEAKEANIGVNGEKIIIRAELFQKQVMSYTGKFGPNLSRSFFLYWSEKEKNKELMKFETYKKFDIDIAFNSFALAAYFKSTLDEDQNKKISKTDIHKWLLTLDQCQRIDGYSHDQIHDIIEYFRVLHDEENGDTYSWRVNFLSPLKMRRDNKDGIKYIDYFWQRIKERVYYGAKEEK